MHRQADQRPVGGQRVVERRIWKDLQNLANAGLTCVYWWHETGTYLCTLDTSLQSLHSSNLLDRISSDSPNVNPAIPAEAYYVVPAMHRPTRISRVTGTAKAQLIYGCQFARKVAVTGRQVDASIYLAIGRKR